jgi:hypothetical protein
MADATQTAGALTQVTATGNTAEIATASKLGLVCSIQHVNGTGTITVGAVIQPQIEHNANWFDFGGAFTANLTASSTQTFTLALPAESIPASAVRFAYTAPTGSTGHTLDVEYTTLDAIE